MDGIAILGRLASGPQIAAAGQDQTVVGAERCTEDVIGVAGQRASLHAGVQVPDMPEFVATKQQ